VSIGSRTTDHIEHQRRFGKSGTIDVHHLQWGTRFLGERKHFLEAGDARRNVHVYWRLRPPRDTEYGQQLVWIEMISSPAERAGRDA